MCSGLETIVHGVNTALWARDNFYGVNNVLWDRDHCYGVNTALWTRDNIVIVCVECIKHSEVGVKK